jgi:hypothetical protein
MPSGFFRSDCAYASTAAGAKRTGSRRHRLSGNVREIEGRDVETTAGIINAQSVTRNAKGELVGEFEAGVGVEAIPSDFSERAGRT